MKKTLVLLLLVGLTACNREKTTWDVNYNAPLIEADLSLLDLTEDSSRFYSNNGLLYVNLNEEFYSISLNELIPPPDTTFSTTLVPPFISLNAPAGLTAIDETDEIDFNIDNARLYKALLRQGTINLTCKNPSSGTLEFIVTLPGVKKNGAPFETNLQVPPFQSEGLFSTTIDFAGYDFDLTGEQRDSYNTFIINYKVKVPDNGPSVFITQSDVFEISYRFSDILFDYVQGNFDGQSLSLNEDFPLEFMQNLSGDISLSEMELDIAIHNGFGITGKIEDGSVVGIGNATLTLSQPELNNVITVQEALGTNTGFTARTKNISFNQQNSNITDFIENLPQTVLVNLDVDLGNSGITSSDNQAWFDSKFAVAVTGQIPLKFQSSGIAIRDTLDNAIQDFFDATSMTDGILKLTIENGLPIDGHLDIYSHNTETLESTLIIDAFEIEGADIIGIGDHTPSTNTILHELTPEQIATLKEDAELIVIFTLNTQNNTEVHLNKRDRIKLKLTISSNHTLGL